MPWVRSDIDAKLSIAYQGWTQRTPAEDLTLARRRKSEFEG